MVNPFLLWAVTFGVALPLMLALILAWGTPS